MSGILLIVIPLLFAFISILVKKAAPVLQLLVSFSLIVLLYFIPLETITVGGFAAPYGISLVVDEFSIVALYTVNILFFLVSTINYCNFKKVASILLVAQAGLNGLLLTGDLFNLFVFIEITGISAYLISTTNKKPLATFNYLVAGTVGSSFYLFGLIILYAMFGTLNMDDLGVHLMQSGETTKVALPFLFMFIGLGVEAKLLPFNSWIKGILGTSNKLSGPMIASVIASATLFVFGRLLTEVFVIAGNLELIVYVILGFSIIAGEAMAYSSTKAREVLLFSSVAQAAIAVLVFASGFTGYGVLFVVLNGFTKAVLFLVVNHITDETGNDEIDHLKGVFANNRLVGFGFTVSVLSVLGLPLFAGFVVKMGILSELFADGGLLFAAIILISSVIEGVYFIKMLLAFWYPEGETVTVKFDVVTTYVVLLIGLLLVVFGVYFTPILDYVNVLVKGGIF